MAGLKDILFGNYAQAIRDERAAATAAQGGQAIQQFAQTGSDGSGAIAGAGHVPPQTPGGLENFAPIDQGTAFASFVIGQSGFEEAGISLFNQAVNNRNNYLQDAQQFTQSLDQNENQFDMRRQDQKDQWQAQQNLRIAAAGEKSDLHTLQMMLSNQQIEAGKKSVISADQNSRIALAKFQRLAPADQVTATTLNNNLFRMQDNIENYQKGYAVNAKTQVGGQFELYNLRNNDKPTDADRGKAAFWTAIETYEQYFGKELSGAEISDSQREAIRRLIPSVTDSDRIIDDKMRNLHAETAAIIERMAGRLDAEGFRDIRPDFAASLNLPATTRGPELTQEMIDALPPGATVQP